jgi:hypothetical protein
MAYTSYPIAGFDTISNALSNLGNTWNAGVKQQQLADLGTSIQSGNYKEAAQKAFAGGDIQIGLSLLKLGQANQPDPVLSAALGGPSTTGTTVPATSGAAPAPVGGFDNALSRTLGFEGTGPVTTDNNGAPVKFGINQAANPDVNVANLDQGQAAKIYKSRYWDILGLDNVDPRLAHVAFDTAVNAGPGKAQELMDASGGDPNKFLVLRQQFQNVLAQSNPDKYGAYASAWNDRINNLRADINAPGGGAQSSAVASDRGDSGEAGDTTGTVAKLRQQRDALLPLINKYGAAGNEAAVKALTLKYNDFGQQIKDAAENYVIHTAPDGQSLIAISKTDPTKVVPIQAGKPKSQAEVDARTQIADQLNLQGDKREQYLLNGKIPDQLRVLKPGDIAIGGQGNTVAQNTNKSAGGARSAVGMYMQQYMSEHPDATSDDISKAVQDFHAQGTGLSRFTSGPQGNTIRSFNVLVDHLGTLGDAVSALGNGNIQLFNKLSQNYAQQTGSTAPTNFDATKTLVGDEIIKAVVGAGGSLADREEAKAVLDRASSPQQLMGAIDQYRKLAVGQLHGLRYQYKSATGRDDFNNLLSPGTLGYFEKRTGSVVPPKEGDTATGPDGARIVLKGGKWVPLK